MESVNGVEITGLPVNHGEAETGDVLICSRLVNGREVTGQLSIDALLAEVVRLRERVQQLEANNPP